MTSAARAQLVVAVLVVAGTVVLALTLARPSAPERPRAPEPAIPTVDVGGVVAAPHVLFRHVAVDAHYNHLSAAPIEAPNASRGVTPLECERVAFGGGRGVCLQAHRGVLTTYDREQALARSGEEDNKGAEAAESAVEMSNLLRGLP